MATVQHSAKLPLSFALLAATLAGCAMSGPSATADADRGDTATPRVLALEECLDPDRARAWALIDSDALLVDAGRHRYRIDLAYACPDVSTATAVLFRGTGGLGRVCGHPGDAVVAANHLGRSSQPCNIRSIETLTEAQYQRLLDDGDLELTGTIGDAD